jgi:AraC family L-rhamnose operon regulatory protein RhaS
MRVLQEIISFGHIENRLMYPHRNPGMEIVLVEQGHLDWAVEQKPEVLNPGSVFFTLPWQVHGSLSVKEPRNRIYYILFSLMNTEQPSNSLLGLPRALGFSPGEEKLLSQILIPAQRHSWPASALLKDLFPRLIQKLEGNSAIDSVAANSLLRALLVELAEIVGSAPSSRECVSASILKVHDFLSSLSGSLEHPWKLQEMAERCSVKRTQLANLCKQLTGYPPMLYVSRIRFERACELLRTTDMSITDIAFECGYNTSQYFAEAFKRFSRMTPSEYRSHLPQLDEIMASNWSHPEDRTIVDEQQRASLIK